MGKVKVLDKHTAELIAAGEVVERPSSVVKELVENSIDAGARAITVEIKQGGVSYIRITDDGEGIAHEDVPVAFLRHATSKIRQRDDLDAIATLGFRGEALASIAAVARVELITRTANKENGTHYVIEGGEELTYDECGCAKGTTIVIRDIFFNTPARMKFLKKDVSEGNAVASIIDRIALSHPEISMRFIRDGKQPMMTSGDGDLRSAIYSVLGKDFAAGLIPVEYTLGNVRVTGFTSKPTAARPTRTSQIFFINDRYCRSATMQAALEQAYKGSVMVGKHPLCVLNLHIDCAAVDVNVHPAKMEVRFTNERPIFDAVYYAIKNALSAGDERIEVNLSGRSVDDQRRLLAPPEQAPPEQMEMPLTGVRNIPQQPVKMSSDAALHSEKADSNAKIALPTPPAAVSEPISQPKPAVVRDSGEKVKAAYASSAGRERFTPPAIPRSPKSYGIDISADDEPDRLPAPAAAPVSDVTTQAPAEEPVPQMVQPDTPVPVQQTAVPEIPVQEETPQQTAPAFSLEECRIIGEAFETYIIVEKGNELVLIDKHAAHERLIYEKLIASQTGAQPQQLLEPLVITLDKVMYQLLLDNSELMDKAGFEIGDFGPGKIVVRAVPMIMCDCDIESTVIEIAENLSQGRMTTMTERMENMYHTISCRSAIKAHDRTVGPELEALVKQLAANTDVRYCPHGRPISITITKRELEKSFGRV